MKRGVFVVDDDADMRAAVTDLLTAAGHEVRAFATGIAARDAAFAAPPSCFVLDIRMPGIGGMELQRELAPLGVPIVFMTGHGDIAMGVGAMKAGAFDFLTKPFREQDLLDAVAQAVRRERNTRDERSEIARLDAAYATLSQRERAILAGVGAGKLNKVIASDLGLSEVTVKIVRGRIMRKLAADSAARLVRFADRLGLVK